MDGLATNFYHRLKQLDEISAKLIIQIRSYQVGTS